MNDLEERIDQYARVPTGWGELNWAWELIRRGRSQLDACNQRAMILAAAQVLRCYVVRLEQGPIYRPPAGSGTHPE